MQLHNCTLTPVWVDTIGYPFKLGNGKVLLMQNIQNQCTTCGAWLLPGERHTHVDFVESNNSIGGE